MKHVFFIIDCSGSILSDGQAKIGQINDLAREAVESALSYDADDVRVICYGNGAKIYWTNDKGGFCDIPENKFGGRSNLGSAYALIRTLITKEKLKLKDCVLALISDGEATDDFKKELELLDPKNESYRVAISLGNEYWASERHALNSDMLVKNIRDRDDFIEKIGEFL